MIFILRERCITRFRLRLSLDHVIDLISRVPPARSEAKQDKCIIPSREINTITFLHSSSNIFLRSASSTVLYQTLY